MIPENTSKDHLTQAHSELEAQPRDNWSLVYNGVSIWSYFRFKYNKRGVAIFRPRLRIGLTDVMGLFQFLLLPFTKNKKIVVACVNRPDILAFVESFLDREAYVLFTRGENSPGNTFFIELIRMTIRRLVPVVRRKRRNHVLLELRKFDSEYPWSNVDVENAIGDYYFNRVLQPFLKGKRIYYTNCIVPRIEKHMGLHDSCEVQHGIIHRDHLDYANLPSDVIKSELIVWNEKWANKITSKIGYAGPVLSADFYFGEETRTKNFNVVVYSTVCDEISRLIDSWMGPEDVALQLHPRDYFPYENIDSKYRLVKDTTPSSANFAILSDSTLILMCIANSVPFFYLRRKSEEPSEISGRLADNYDAIFGIHYHIVDSIEEALSRIRHDDTLPPLTES